MESSDETEYESSDASSVDDRQGASSDASSIDDTEDESSDASSEIRGNKRLEFQGKEDRISALPDSLIHHILSFLPSTKQAVKTGILSKRWKNQWAHVPVLIFKSIDPVVCDEGLARFIDNTLLLYNSSKIRKFHISYNFKKDININFTSKILFATRKYVEELILDFYNGAPAQYMLPKFIFDKLNLVKLQIVNCDFQLSWSINWPSLKALKMNGRSLKDSRSIQNVLSGSPSLESFEICYLNAGFPFIIASKSLKILNLVAIEIRHDIEISCPNLEELCIVAYTMCRDSIFLNKTIVNVLCGSPLLRSLELKYCFLHQLVIASESLKRLYFDGRYQSCTIEISCPNLEVLNLRGSKIETCKLMNLPSSSCATLDFVTPSGGSGKNLARKILEGLQPVKELKVRNWFVEILSTLEMGGQSYPLLNIKCLTLVCPNFKDISGIVNALRCSPALERLVIELNDYKCLKIADLDLNNFEETYRNSNGTVLTCLVSHLKTVKIIGLSKRDGKLKVVLQFVEFLLKNARMLEKMIVKVEYDGTDFLLKVSRKLLSLPRCSQHAIVELL